MARQRKLGGKNAGKCKNMQKYATEKCDLPEDNNNSSSWLDPGVAIVAILAKHMQHMHFSALMIQLPPLVQ